MRTKISSVKLEDLINEYKSGSILVKTNNAPVENKKLTATSNDTNDDTVNNTTVNESKSKTVTLNSKTIKMKEMDSD